MLMEHYSAENDFGRRIVSGDYSNPLYSQLREPRVEIQEIPFSKSNKEVLPSRFVRYCREIICPDGSTNFTELKWAQSSTEVAGLKYLLSLLTRMIQTVSGGLEP
ncbi:MAG: hypothetical protein IPL05_09675 [Betaproteobacteria bacterium]|nr:hypothetical protein [Betaproteobacteria bacterium]